MKSVYQSRAVSYPPELPNSASSEGYPTNGSSTGGVLATVIGDYWYNAVTQEIVNAIKGGGVTPDAADLTQLDAAIKAQIRTVNQALSDVAAQIQAKVSQVEVVPSGMIMFFPKSTPPNGNWLICDGRAVSRTGYPNLFAMNVTQYGGDGRQQMYCEPVSTDGAFWQETKNARAAGDASNWIGDMTAAVHFDASRSNPIYGRSGTVQPPALVLLPCIHI